ncbi:MAG: ABC transporter permease [Actinomycetota bacterium]|nr:ABC transporter permease [Actinomycetota bacterium]
MAAIEVPAAAAPSARTSPRWETWHRLRRNQLAVAGLVVIGLVALLALLAPVLPLDDPAATELDNRLEGVGSPGHVLGTDELGRDMLSRLVWGARSSLSVGVAATLLAATIGSIIGLVAGFFSGLVDSVLMRAIDMLMAFPYILFAVAIVAFRGPGLGNAMIAIAVVNVPFFARAVRGTTVTQASLDYVDAARNLGYSPPRILLREVLPNVVPTILVTMSTTVGWMITETAGLSFLGLGAQPPTADWGAMLGAGRDLITTAPHMTLVPGLAIFVVVVSVNLLGDGLRDALDPRLR